MRNIIAQQIGLNKTILIPNVSLLHVTSSEGKRWLKLINWYIKWKLIKWKRSLTFWACLGPSSCREKLSLDRVVSLWRMAYARNVHLRFLHRHYTNFVYIDAFIFPNGVPFKMMFHQHKVRGVLWESGWKKYNLAASSSIYSFFVTHYRAVCPVIIFLIHSFTMKKLFCADIKLGGGGKALKNEFSYIPRTVFVFFITNFTLTQIPVGKSLAPVRFWISVRFEKVFTLI